MKENLCEIVCIIDRSGSMARIKDDAIGGFNAFIQGQREVPGDAIVTYVQFDHDYEVVFAAKPLQQVGPIDGKIYVPRGQTALLDAIGRTISEVGARLSTMAETDRPGKVIVVILTDGHENFSREMTLSRVREMIQHQQDKYGWKFVFLGAEPSVFSDAAAMGIDLRGVSQFDKTSGGIQNAYAYAGGQTTDYRKEK